MPAPTLPRTPSHHHEWASACLGKGTTLSPFSYASVLTESLLLGNVALRAGKTIQWDRDGDARHRVPRGGRLHKA